MAVVTSAVVVGASTVYAAKKGSDAAKDGAKAQVEAADKGVELQRESRDIARQDLQPFTEMGTGAISSLQDLAKPTATPDFRAGVTLNPNYNANYQDFNRDTEFTGTVDQLDANTRFDANIQDINRDTEFRADPRRVYNDAEDNVQGRFNEAADVVADQVSARQAAKGKLGSGNTLVDLFRENTMLKEGLTQNEFGRLRRLEDRDRMNLAQDAQIFGDNQSRELQDADFNRGSELARAGLFDQNFNRDVRVNDANRLNTLANADLFNQNYGRDMAKAGFNQGAEQLRERTANNNFARNMDLAGLNQREIAMKDALKGADFNRNLNLVNLGQASAAGQAATTSNAGNSIADLYTQQGNATAAGKIGSANAYAGGVNNLAGLAGLYMGIPPKSTFKAPITDKSTSLFS